MSAAVRATISPRERCASQTEKPSSYQRLWASSAQNCRLAARKVRSKGLKALCRRDVFIREMIAERRVGMKNSKRRPTTDD
jgi:hypothetical protein